MHIGVRARRRHRTPRRPMRVANGEPDPTSLVVPHSLASSLLQLYDSPDPRQPGRLIRGYDRLHALRTARMCGAVAMRLGHPPARVASYQVACLLHDVGRAGLDRRLFGKIWSWAKRRAIPTRPREWRAFHPETRYGRETEAFLSRHASGLQAAGIRVDAWAREQVEMRLGYARRLMRRLRAVNPQLRRLGVKWTGWMTLVVLYYYYPEKLKRAPRWVRQLAEILVACEQFEAYSNRRRGRDYYTRTRESLEEAFTYLEQLRGEGILSRRVVAELRRLAAEGAFDQILAEARGAPLSSREVRYLRSAAQGATLCR